MNFKEAVASGFSKYVEFGGRAARSEYWYWFLFVFVVSICLSVLDIAVFPANDWSPLSTVFSLAVFLPGLAVGARRLHDIDKSAWWLLLCFLPVIGWIILLVWAIFKGTSGENRFGADPLGGGGAVSGDSELTDQT